MKKEYNPKQYWKHKIGFDTNEELLIYQYLCGNIKKKKIKKLDPATKFREYKTWKMHVERILQNCEDDNLLEFYHFIRSNARSCDNILGMYTHFAMPLVISVIAGWFIPKLLDSFLPSNVQIQQFSFWELIILFAIYCFIILILFMIVACPFMYF